MYISEIWKIRLLKLYDNRAVKRTIQYNTYLIDRFSGPMKHNASLGVREALCSHSSLHPSVLSSINAGLTQIKGKSKTFVSFFGNPAWDPNLREALTNKPS